MSVKFQVLSYLSDLDPDDTEDTETLPKIRDVTSMPSETIKSW